MKLARLLLLPQCHEHHLCQGFLASSSSSFPFSLTDVDWLHHPKTPGWGVPQPSEESAPSGSSLVLPAITTGCIWEVPRWDCHP